jgi:alkaline phosphatase D
MRTGDRHCSSRRRGPDYRLGRLWWLLALCLPLAATLLGPGAMASRVSAVQLPPGDTTLLTITHGIASGDVTARSAVVWARVSRAAQMHVQYDTDPQFRGPLELPPIEAVEATDFTAQVKLEPLEPDTVYQYRIWFSAPSPEGRALSEVRVGIFKTAPDAAQRRPVSFVVGGDLGGSGICRRADQGYAIFAAMQLLSPDFFVANGDMIYADHDCPAEGPGGRQNVPGDFPRLTDPSVDWTNLAQVRDVYLRHWRYNRADPAFQTFLQRTPVYAQWDDHEVINDSGTAWTYWNAANRNRPGYANLAAAGREALFLYWPIDRQPAAPDRIYRSFRWGQDLELFLLDTRSYRSRNDLEDTPANNKTLLGAEQLRWLKEGLRSSSATWKVISSDVTLAMPTGGAATGRDGWASGTGTDAAARTGFERELLDLMRFLDDARVRNTVWVATDVHVAANIRYELDLNGDGDTLRFHELISGPLSAFAGPEPRQERLDPTLRSTLLYGESGTFNFSHVRIAPAADGQVHLLADVRGPDGQPRPGSQLALVPQ